MTRHQRDIPRANDDARLARFQTAIHELLDQVSHDFRTPLTVIKEFATLMGDGLVGEVGPRQQEFLEVINDRADDLTLIVDNVLDTGKLDAGALRAWRRATDAAEVIESVRGPLARKTRIKGVDLDVAVEPGLPAVWADRDQLARILLNLVAGILKSFETPRAMRITADSDVEAGRVRLGVAVEGGRIARKQFDSITAALAAAQAGSRPDDGRRARGAAWRFALAGQLVALHYGQIRPERSKRGETAFRVSLPVAAPRRVLEGYARRAMQTHARPVAVRLVVVSMDSKAPATTAGVVDEFLQNILNGDDLAVPISSRRWLLVLGARRTRGVMGQIESRWTEMRNRRHGRRLPRLEWNPVGRWNPAEGVGGWIEPLAAGAVPASRPRRESAARRAADATGTLATAN